MRSKKGKRLARVCLPDKRASPQLWHHRGQAGLESKTEAVDGPFSGMLLKKERRLGSRGEGWRRGSR